MNCEAEVFSSIFISVLNYELQVPSRCFKAMILLVYRILLKIYENDDQEAVVA